jgi:hypothetical protein
MASPFSVFRKRQKLMMALLCLMAIVAFVFLPNMGNLVGRGSDGRKDLVVVKTKKYGDLKRSDIANLRANKQKVRGILTDLLILNIQDPRVAQNVVNERFGGVTDEALVDTWLRMHRAKEIGIAVTDSMVTQFLEQWTGNRVKIEDIQGVFKRAQVSDRQFYILMRDELLARQLVDTFLPSVVMGGQPIATPSQRWDWFNRVNRMAVIEAVPLPVSNADYLGKVEKPTDKVLEKFFDENKHAIQYPASPEPGFRRPQKVVLEYFKADIAEFAKTVTDAEVQKLYEENKEYLDSQFKVRAPEQPAKAGTAKDAGAAKKADGTKPNPQSNATKEVPKAKTPVDTKKGPTADMKGTEGAKALKDAPKTTPKESDKPKDSKKDASSADKQSPFMLAAMQAEKAADTSPKSSPKAELPKKSASPAKAESPAAKSAAKESKPAAKPATTAKKAQGSNGELPDVLKAHLRRAVAERKIRETLDRLRKPMEEYQQARRKYDLLKIQCEHEKKKVPPLPPALDFKKLAKENGLSADHTKLVAFWEAAETDIGRSVVERTNSFVYAFAYRSLPEFRPTQSFDPSAGAAYLFWKSEDKKEYVPRFDDKGMHEEVLLSWKMIKARDLAKKAAETLAEEANKTGKSLKKAFVNRMDLRVVLPPKFSWMTVTNVALTSRQRPQARISPVAGVEMAQDEFMSTVFGLQPGQAGVAFNSPKTVIYVVRPSEFTPLYEVRWKLFLAESFASYAAAGEQDQIAVFRAWNEDIRKSAGFEWGPGHSNAEQEGEAGQPAQQPMDEED